MKRILIGTAAALASMAVLTSAMLPLRGSISIATTALILVMPVVIGVVIGGFVAGVVSVVAGFLVYVFFFIPPYLTFWVGGWQNWAALGVYAVVMLPVAQVVAGMNTARSRELRQGRELRKLFELSDLLVEDKPLDVLLSVIVTSVLDVTGAAQVALLLPDGDADSDTRLEIAAAAGRPLTDHQLRAVGPAPGNPRDTDGELLALPLAASGRPIGLLALSADAAARHQREPLLLFANQIALAVERAQLREQALRTRVNEEMARLAKTLVAAVAHDLRSPLATIKASSSTLSDARLDIGTQARQELTALIDVQADRLSDLVQNLLDMSRIQAGALQPRCTVAPLSELVGTVLNDPALGGLRISTDLPDDLPPIDADLVLMSRVLANLIDNAARHSPPGASIQVRAISRTQDNAIELSVTDHGPGVEADRRDDVFGLFVRRDGDAGAGLGLAIAKTFVEAHGQRIWIEDAPGGGARFCFTLPAAAPIPEESRLATSSHH
jgi:two-component system sensor histidine kinase KdpD